MHCCMIHTDIIPSVINIRLTALTKTFNPFYKQKTSELFYTYNSYDAFRLALKFYHFEEVS
jgi:hypothetical protein